MVTSAARWPPAFASTVNSTTPGPLPGDPDVTVSQVTGLAAVHVHPAVVVTVTWKLPPPAGIDCAPEPETAYSHVPAACWICARTPLTTIAVCRIEGDGLAATSTRSVPLPWPADGSIFATQLASAEAVHAHSGVVVSATCSLPPDELTAAAGAARVSAHLTGVGSVVVTDVDPQAASSALLTARSARRSDHGVNRAVTFSRTMRVL